MVKRLAEYSSKTAKDSIILKDFPDFFLRKNTHEPIWRPWVGVFHIPNHKSYRKQLIKSRCWHRSRKNLKGVIFLSKYVAESYLSSQTFANHVDCPYKILKFTMPPVERRFSIDRFHNQKRILQYGFFLKNSLALDQLPPIEGYNKVKIKPPKIRTQLRRPILDNDVVIKKRISNDRLNRWLSSSCVFAEFIDCGASNIIVECILRNTPLVVNRHPSIEEYLTPDYPLFYDKFEDARLLFNRAEEGHEFLKQINLPTVEDFVAEVRTFISEL